MDEVNKMSLIEYFNTFDKEAEKLECFEYLYIIELKKIINVDVPLNKIYDCVRRDYNKHTSKDTKDRNVLYKYLREKERYNLLNSLILKIYKTMVEDNSFNDLFVLYNFELFNCIITKEVTSIIPKNNLVNIEFTKLSNLEINNIIEDFLTKIDPTLKWLDIYRNAKDNGTIIEIDKLSDSDREKYKKIFGNLKNGCVTYNNVPYVLLENSNTLKYIYSFVHEFSHYIIMSYRKSENISRFLGEFPSIFYERYFAYYINDKGFSKEEIDYLVKQRNKRTLNNYFDIVGVLRYIRILLDGKKITEEDEIINFDGDINSLSLEYLEMLKKNYTDIDITDSKTIVNKICDRTRWMLIKYPYAFNELYPYITGSYLADQTLKKVRSDESFLENMKYITENLSTIEPSNIFNELGLDVDKMKEEVK